MSVGTEIEWSMPGAGMSYNYRHVIVYLLPTYEML